MRFRLTQTTVVEYEVQEEYYADTTHGTSPTPQEMLEIDINNCKADPVWINLLDNDDKTKITVTGEIL